MSVTAMVDRNSIAAMASEWRVHQTRKSIYQDVEQMDTSDETVATSLDIIADCSVAYNEDAEYDFRITSDDTEALRILKALDKRLSLANEVWQIARDMVKHGDEPREVVIDRKKMQIIDLKQTISYQVYPNTNSKGDKIPGWVVKEDAVSFNATKDQELEEWQIVMFSFGSRKGTLVAPPLASARRNWVRLTKIEDGMAVARLCRAYDKYVHHIPVVNGMDKGEIMARIRLYKDLASKKRVLDSDGFTTQNASPLEVDTDFYLPDDGTNRGGVELLSANNAQLGNLNDVLYQREKLLTRLQVPIAYLQITSAQKTHLTAGNQKSDVERQFARMLRRVQRSLLKGLKRVCDMELMLNGINPTDDLYTIHLTQIDTKDMLQDAEIELTYAQAAVYFKEAFGSLPPELIAEKFMRLTPEQQKLMESFLSKYNDRLLKASVKSIEEAAKPKPTGGGLMKDRLPGDNKGSGSGNQNKSRSSRTTEQLGKSKTGKQSLPLEAMVEAFYSLAEEVNQAQRDAGNDEPVITESHMDSIRDRLIDIAQSVSE